MARPGKVPFGPLRYLYVGSSRIQKDIDYYTQVLGAVKIWDLSRFGARIAALRLGPGPLILLADHRPAGSCILIFEVDNLKDTSKRLREKGWMSEGDKFEIPEGPCYGFNDPSGNPIALLQVGRPNALGMERDPASDP